MRDIDDYDFEDDDEDDVDLKDVRKKRLANKRRRDSVKDFEKRLKPVRKSRNRPRIVYDPQYDDDDYEEFYDED